MIRGCSSWINGEVEKHICTIEKMRIKLRGDANLPKKLWCFSYNHATERYGALIHSATKESPDYQWYGVRRSSYDFRVWGFQIEAVQETHLSNLENRTETGYFLWTTTTRSVIRCWNPLRPKTSGYYTTAKFN